MKDIKEVLKEKILVLDGGLGTMIQSLNLQEKDFRGREFITHPVPVFGFNDILNITSPSSIKKIHFSYLEAGANIITTNTFNSNFISMSDYGLDQIEGLNRRLNREGAKIAKESVEEFLNSNPGEICYVAGSIGPTNRSLSISPDITNPLKRNVSYDELYRAYEEQISGLIEGGVDILLFETFFDTLNLKCGLDAAGNVMKNKNKFIPIFVSATVSDKAGRLLSGQTLKAFVTSIAHYEEVMAIGLNCGFGPDKMSGYLKQINEVNPYFTSCHPNAGLPDETGCYNVNPEEFGESLKAILGKKEINVVGGCCGTTPAHIRLVSRLVKDYKPKPLNHGKEILRLAGLDMLSIDKGFTIVGERCNVAGSAKFLRLIKEHNYEEASEVAKLQIEKGAKIIDINMDDALLDSEKEMIDFIRYILAEPAIAKVPFMIDSSKWKVIEASLKNIQGKGIVNSLSLKEGEEIFIKRARKVRELGFVLVVMAFDERGQAETYERKIEICRRAYTLLTDKCGYRPEDIIFDVNVMTVATGMKEHSRYAIDFIEAVRWIKTNLPGAKTSGGVSNLSFAFRGRNKIREQMHSVFLHHAIGAGLDMAIINPATQLDYAQIPIAVRKVIEDVLFDKDPQALEKLIELANDDIKEKNNDSIKKETNELKDIRELLKEDLMEGKLLGIEDHLKKALEEFKDPIKIIEGPLLQGMKTVGDLFGEGKMFLPQVVKTARSMKKAVDFLTPYIEQNNEASGGKKNGKILIATVKGDVHDIGKNIVSTVLSCNNYDIIDLGIMVPGERILEVTIKENPDIICLSGLITPSLGEMVKVVNLLKEAGITTPVMVGGAATSSIHTALRIAPEYEGIVIHMGDASQNPVAANELLNTATKERFISDLKEGQKKLVENHSAKKRLVPFDEVLDIVKIQKRNNFFGPKPCIEPDATVIIKLPLVELREMINWKMFFSAWKVQGKYLQEFPYHTTPEKRKEWAETVNENDRQKVKEAIQLYEKGLDIIAKFQDEGNFDGKGSFVFKKSHADEKNVWIGDKVFPMLRQQAEGSGFLSCSDLIGEGEDNYIGLFSVTSGRKMKDYADELEQSGNSYDSLIVQTLADRIAEAGAEWLQKHVKSNYWPVEIRPAWGYPMLPDHSLILETKEFIHYEETGISLTENGAMYPPASISGLYFSKPDAKYFMIGEIGKDQLEDYARRRNIPFSTMKLLLRN